MTDDAVPSLATLAERLTNERALRLEHQASTDREYLEFKIEMQRRLGELNNAHEAAVLEQARTVPRDMFDQFVKENDARREAAFRALGDRLEASVKTTQDTVAIGHEALGKEIEIERNARIRAEGSVAVWRFIAVFLGFPGVIGLILAAIALFGTKGTIP